MKFLSICTTKDSFMMIPPVMSRQLLEATMTWTDQQKKAGKILENYYVPGGKVVAICEHPSFEDLNKTIASMPTYGFMDFQIYPLSDINEAMKLNIEALRAGEKLFSTQTREMAGVR